LDYRLINNPDARNPKPSTEYANLTIDNVVDFIEVALKASSSEDVPNNVEEARGCDEAEKWEGAMGEELEMMKKMGTWELVDLPEGKNIVGCKWVFTKKRDEEGRINRFKARLVAQGFSQKPGVDYSNTGTFAPVMRFESLRTHLALAAVNNWELRQFDVKSAYLNGSLDEEIYMRQPPGFDDGSGRVCRLKKSIYGLKQAGNIWNREFTQAMGEIDFYQLKTDNCVFVRQQKDVFSILLIWVDDIIAVMNSNDEANRLELELANRFEIKSLGDPSLILGIQVSRDKQNHTVIIHQSTYISTLLSKFSLSNVNPVNTPMDLDVKLDYEQNESQIPANDEIAYSYATLIGSLMYLAIATRPDISFAVQRLAQFTRNPKQRHWTAVKRVFRYLKGTKNWGIRYGGRDGMEKGMEIYSDADWANSLDRKSVSGYVFTIAGGAVAWGSKKQTTVALSTAEAEYVAAVHSAKQVMWFKSLFTELDYSLTDIFTIMSDNQAAVSIAHHPEFHARTKHMDISLQFLRDHIQKKDLAISYIPTHENVADILTKGLPRPAHEKFVGRMGVVPGQGGVLEVAG
ncbi:hypothetical protein M378DRAFT_87411, partial [Amanita muscaria Koide BX008]